VAAKLVAGDEDEAFLNHLLMLMYDESSIAPLLGDDEKPDAHVSFT